MAQPTDLSLADVDDELDTTRRVLERLPEEQLSWKPHDKSRTVGELGAHIADVVALQVAVLTQDELDFGGSPPPSLSPESKSGILAGFDANVEDLRAALQGVDESVLSEDWTLRVGDHVVFTSPRLVVFRSFGLGHIGHHRGQLSVYLRLLDVPVPPVYGPTADEA